MLSTSTDAEAPVKREKPPSFPYHWMLLALLSHTGKLLCYFINEGWGVYPVLARYLQHVGGLPPLSLLATGLHDLFFYCFRKWICECNCAHNCYKKGQVFVHN
jgi:hypothetical protein